MIIFCGLPVYLFLVESVFKGFGVVGVGNRNCRSSLSVGRDTDETLPFVIKEESCGRLAVLVLCYFVGSVTSEE